MNEDILEKCLVKIGNKFILVLLIIYRIKQLNSGHKPLIENFSSFNNNFYELVLNEIIQGKLKVVFKNYSNNIEEIKKKYTFFK